MSYFNSHAHVERDNRTVMYKDGLHISTHTLTWSVTSAIDEYLRGNVISTHTLTWSVTAVPRI